MVVCVKKLASVTEEELVCVTANAEEVADVLGDAEPEEVLLKDKEKDSRRDGEPDSVLLGDIDAERDMWGQSCRTVGPIMSQEEACHTTPEW